MSISIIIPTKGRETVKQAVKSLIHQVDETDEIIVVGDSVQPNAWSFLAPLSLVYPQIRYTETWRPGSLFGTTQRDHGIRQAKGDWIAFLDDDDIYTKGALATMRATLMPGKPNIYRMQYFDERGMVLWVETTLRVCNIGTPMIVVPNRPDLPEWFRADAKSCFDWLWLTTVMNNLYPDNDVAWHEDITCIVRPTKETSLREIPCLE